MAKLRCWAIMSLDGYVADDDGAADKVVYSKTLEALSTARTRIELFVAPVLIGGGNPALARGSGCTWSCWTSASSATAWCTSDTVPPDRRPPKATVACRAR